ncbi:MAG: hypothetical protein JWN17_2682 [Frankiales bacterium]|nr:hypothetical protein [Frankiales bacterium]
MPVTGDGVRPVGPLRDLPADDRQVLDAGAGRRVTLARSPYDGVPLHELAALAVLRSTGSRRESLVDVGQASPGRRAQNRLSRTTHKLACSGERHTVKVDADGPVAVSHPDLDLESEAVAVALGMPAPPCVQLLLDWPRRGVHLPERLEAARTLHRLAGWEGATAAVRDVALSCWLTPEQAQEWAASGLSVVDAAVWRWHGVEEAWEVERWTDLGCDPGQAAAVLDTGVDLAALEPWLQKGTPAPLAALLVRAGADRPDRLQR